MPDEIGPWPRIPVIQRRMHILVDELLAPGLLPMTTDEIGKEFRGLIVKLSRRPRKTNAPVKSRRITPSLRALMAEYQRRNPTATQQEIAVIFNVTAGRVSEAIAGKRE